MLIEWRFRRWLAGRAIEIVIAALGIVIWGYIPLSPSWAGYTISLQLAVVSAMYFEIASGYLVVSLWIWLKVNMDRLFYLIVCGEILFMGHFFLFAFFFELAFEVAVISFVVGLVATTIANVVSFRIFSRRDA